MIKEAETCDLRLEGRDVGAVQSLSTLLEEMNAESLAFWLRKFIGEVTNSEGARYRARPLYCIVSGLSRHLSEVKGREAINILDKDDRR